MNLTGRLLGYLWLSLLGLLLLCSALTADRRSQQVEEYPFGCDSFGYLQTAQAIRQRATARDWPQLAVQEPHTQLLIDFMKTRNVELEGWEEIVAPHAYRYFPQSGLVGPVFPPGAGLLLAIFPQGDALHRMNRTTICVFLACGLAMLVFAAIRQTWLSAGIVILVLHLGLTILGRIGNASYSINALLAPLLLSGLCLVCAFHFQHDRRRAPALWLFALLAGALFGFAVLVRPPVGFVLPGLLALLWPAQLRALLKSALLPFGLGVLVGGVLPLGLFQNRLVGAWYLPTYGRSDMALPTLEAFRSNLSFYLGHGEGNTDNWILIAVVVCCVCLIQWPGRLGKSDQKPPAGAMWQRLLVAASLMWALPMLYFLTHKVAVHFYAVPATFATGLLLALGVLFLELKKKTNDLSSARGIRLAALIVVTIAPGLIVMNQLRATWLPAASEAKPRQFVIPAELADEHSWIWGGMLTGTLWYYGRIPAYKVQFTVPPTRALLYEFVSARGEKQYFIRDSPDMQMLENEIIALGGTLELRGSVDDYPYFLIHWPPSGPRKGGARVTIPKNNSAGEGQ
jgi:4-amino-4-deoxy-L-arabinose transferase-like glycosyltransferase